MTKISSFALFCARALTGAPRAANTAFGHSALSELTDAQLNRNGMTRAGIVHHTFSGFYYA